MKLTTALLTPSANAIFQKSTVNTLMPHISTLATSQFGHNVIVAIAQVPTRGKDFSVPTHIKESVMQTLAGQEREMRDCWMGRSAWRAWKGDMWKTRRGDWKAWIKEQVAEEQGPLTGVNGEKRGEKKEKREKKMTDEAA